MTTPRDVAPHICPECGFAAYIGFGIGTRCIKKACFNFDADLLIEYVQADPDWDNEDTPAKGFFIKTAPPTGGHVFRDFCSNCHIAIDFHRYPTPTGWYAFCTQCGHRNDWS